MLLSSILDPSWEKSGNHSTCIPSGFFGSSLDEKSDSEVKVPLFLGGFKYNPLVYRKFGLGSFLDDKSKNKAKILRFISGIYPIVLSNSSLMTKVKSKSLCFFRVPNIPNLLVYRKFTIVFAFLYEKLCIWFFFRWQIQSKSLIFSRSPYIIIWFMKYSVFGCFLEWILRIQTSVNETGRGNLSNLSEFCYPDLPSYKKLRHGDEGVYFFWVYKLTVIISLVYDSNIAFFEIDH